MTPTGTSLGTMYVEFGAKVDGLVSGIGDITNKIIGFGVQVTQMAGNFQANMTALVTGAGESQKNLAMVSSGILNIAGQVGDTTQELSDGMYLIESAGQHGSQALTTLTDAAEGAKVGSASLADVANGVTTAMTDYASSGLTAAAATNDLVATVADGKTHMGDLATAMSTILPTSAAVGVSFTDVSGAMATLTGEGVNAASAATYLRQMLMALDVPGSLATKTLNSLGLSTTEVSDEMKKSLPDALAMITDALKKKFPEGSAAYVAAIKDISGGSKNMQAMLDLTGSHLSVFGQNVTDIASKVKGAGGAIQGWALTQQDFNTKWDQFNSAIEVIGIKIGTVLLPYLGKVLDFIQPIVTQFSNWAGSSSGLAGYIDGIAKAFNEVFFPAQQATTAMHGFATLASRAPIDGGPWEAFFQQVKVVWDYLSHIDWGGVGASMSKFFSDAGTAIKNVDWGNVGADIQKIATALGRVAWDVVAKQLGDLSTNLSKADWKKVGDDISSAAGSFSKMKDTITLAFNTINSSVQPFWDAAMFIVNSFQWVYDRLVGHSIIPDLMSEITTEFKNLPGQIMGAIGSLGTDLSGFFGGLAQDAYSWGANIINNLTSSMSGGFGGFHIPGFASGVTNFGGGMAVVGENGPEVMYVPQGANIYPSTGSSSAYSSSGAYGSGGGMQVHNHIYLDGYEMTNILGPRIVTEMRKRVGMRA